MVKNKYNSKKAAYKQNYDAWVESLNISDDWISDPDMSRTQERRWDDKAEGFSEKPMPTKEDSLFLRTLLERAEPGPDTTVLDIGSGSGHYSIALAPHAGKILGIDISGNMVGHANDLALRHGADNVSFIQKDWSAMSSDDSIVKDGFDIVFAHMTPGVGDADDFTRMIDACNGHLFMTKPVRRCNPLAEGIWGLFDMDAPVMSSDKEMAYAFILGWQRGYNPEFFYERSEWEGIVTVEEAAKIYRDEFSYRGLEFDEDKVMDHLRSISDHGMVDNTTYTEKATIHWSFL